MDPFILASTSPRRRELLEFLKIPFEVIPSSGEEVFDSSPPFDQAVFLAEMKVKSVLLDHPELEERLILGADTVLDVDGGLIGKAPDRSTAEAYLELISGRTHRVITALSLWNGNTKKFLNRAQITDITVATMKPFEIEWYLNTGEWRGAAGAYRIQGKGGLFVEKIEGCFYNVVGLPIHLFYGMLQSQGFSLSETL